MNITLQDPRRCQSKQNSFPHQQDKHARRGRERGGETGRESEREREREGGRKGDKKREERLFKKGMGGK